MGVFSLQGEGGGCRRGRRRSAKPAALRPSLRWALSAMGGAVAFVRDPRQNLLAVNDLGCAFYSPLIGDGGRVPNLARFQFLDPAAHDFYPDWDLFAQMCVAIMHAEAGRDPHDKGLQNLAITAEPGNVLMIYTAEPGSASAERLAILASWALEHTDAGATA